jgi:hybrid cluster-associated redox disulfide protein
MSALLARDWTVEQVLEVYPHIADIFIRLKADCVGCRLEWFCTLEDVAREYSLVLDDFLAELEEAVSDIAPKDCERRSI